MLNIVISCDGGVTQEVLNVVESFTWDYGDYKVVLQPKQLGVDLHNIACIGMALDLGHVVVLEDDLVVSPHFQSYLLETQTIVKTERRLAGLSLYRYPLRESNRFPFELIPNNEFLYYQQRASSKGCLYTKEMAQDYLAFYHEFSNEYSSFRLPRNVQRWKDVVWEKSFYAYLQHSDRYVGFPRFSLTTDFADPGVHMQKQVHKYQHQSKLYQSETYGEIKKIEETENVYDAFYEVHPNTVRKYVPYLDHYEFEMDLYGDKDLTQSSAPYAISEKRCVSFVKGWDRRMKPELLNLLMDQEGEFFHLANREDFSVKRSDVKLKENFLYYYPDTRLVDLVKMKWKEVVSRFTRS